MDLKTSATTANMMSDMISLMLILDYDPFLNFKSFYFLLTELANDHI